MEIASNSCNVLKKLSLYRLGGSLRLYTDPVTPLSFPQLEECSIHGFHISGFHVPSLKTLRLVYIFVSYAGLVRILGNALSATSLSITQVILHEREDTPEPIILPKLESFHFGPCHINWREYGTEKELRRFRLTRCMLTKSPTLKEIYLTSLAWENHCKDFNLGGPSSEWPKLPSVQTLVLNVSARACCHGLAARVRLWIGYMSNLHILCLIAADNSTQSYTTMPCLLAALTPSYSESPPPCPSLRELRLKQISPKRFPKLMSSILSFSWRLKRVVYISTQTTKILHTRISGT